jgi:8-hydroxy-5-deazaflavin:NADPH oxidoreductase
MKVGVLGSGDVGKALAGGFLDEGHEVMLGTRTPANLSAWMQQKPTAKVGTFAQTAGFGDVIVLAVQGSVAHEVLGVAGAANLAGKVVIDATNPIADAPPTDGVLRFFTDLNESLMERLQKTFPAARFVKAFNSVGNARMIHPQYGGIQPTMFICGNDTEAKQIVTRILTEFGWETEDMGTAAAARAIEPLCMLWCIPGFTRNQWTHAFKLLK